MTAACAPEAYVFGSPENHDLLEAESNELLHFGHRFPAPNGGSTWLDKDNHVIGTVWPGKSDLYHALQCTFIPRLNPAVSVAPALMQATETR